MAFILNKVGLYYKPVLFDLAYFTTESVAENIIFFLLFWQVVVVLHSRTFSLKSTKWFQELPRGAGRKATSCALGRFPKHPEHCNLSVLLVLGFFFFLLNFIQNTVKTVPPGVPLPCDPAWQKLQLNSSSQGVSWPSSPRPPRCCCFQRAGLFSCNQ